MLKDSSRVNRANRSFRKYFSTITLLLGLTSCASHPLQNSDITSTSTAVQESDCGSPNQYALNALQWSDEARNSELDRLASVLEYTNDHCGVLELAIFLSTPTLSYQDDNKAILLFDKLLTNERLSHTERDYIMQILPHIEQRQGLRRLLESSRSQ